MILPNEFDSGRLAPRVGRLVHAGPEPPPSADALRGQARAGGYDYVEVESPEPLPALADRHVGTLVCLEAGFDPLFERHARRALRYPLRPLGLDEVGRLRPLYAQYGHSRFTLDARLPRERVVDHKLAVIAHHLAANPGLGVVHEGPPGILGFHLATVASNVHTFYEVVVESSHRVGFLARDLIASALRAGATRLAQPATARARTRIYADNPESLLFFHKLGLCATGERQHFYRVWAD